MQDSLVWMVTCSAQILTEPGVVLAVPKEGTYDMSQKQLIISASLEHYYLLLLGLRQEMRSTGK